MRGWKMILVGVVIMLILGWWMWQGTNSRTTVVLATPSLLVWSFDPAANKAVVWQLPDNLQIEVVGGYGMYAVKAVVGLDRQEKQQGRLVRDSVGYFLGVGVDGEIITPKTYGLPRLLDKGWVETVLWQNMWVKPWLVKVWWVMAHLRPDQVEVIDLALSNSLSLHTLPDGSVVYQADLVQVTSLVQRYMTDEGLVNEGVEVLVTNATDSLGLGAIFSRMLSTLGIRVVGLEDDKENLSTSELLVQTKNMRHLRTVRYLERLIQVPVVVSPIAGGRADVVVRLGEDYKTRIRGK